MNLHTKPIISIQNLSQERKDRFLTIAEQLTMLCIKAVSYTHLYQGEVGKKAENLIQRQFEALKPMEKCYTDVTEFAISLKRAAKKAIRILSPYYTYI